MMKQHDFAPWQSAWEILAYKRAWRDLASRSSWTEWTWSRRDLSWFPGPCRESPAGQCRPSWSYKSPVSSGHDIYKEIDRIKYDWCFFFQKLQSISFSVTMCKRIRLNCTSVDSVPYRCPAESIGCSRESNAGVCKLGNETDRVDSIASKPEQKQAN